MIVNILGAKYKIYERSQEQDELLKDCDGYCDKTIRTIVVTTNNINLGNFEEYRKKILRHEIIHAFLFESGLQENFEHRGWGHEETMVDWVACQFPKILEVYKKVGCI